MRWIGFPETKRFPLNKGEEAIRLAFADLTEEFRLPLWFSLGLGLSHAEISEVLGLPRDRVRKSLGTGRSLLLQACEAVGNKSDIPAIESLLARMASEPAPTSLMKKLTLLTRASEIPQRPVGYEGFKPRRVLAPANTARRSRAGGIPVVFRPGKDAMLGSIARMRRR